MPPQPQFPQLAFAANGTVLLHATPTTVTAWDFETRQKRYTCAGRLVGVSRSSATFVTEHTLDTYGLWASATGAPQPLTPTVSDDLPFDVRYRVTLTELDRGHYHGHWRDVTGLEAPAPITVRAAHTTRLEKLENWLVVSPQRWLACSWFWAEDDFDGSFGNYAALAGEAPGRVSFTVSRFHTPPPLYFSRDHDWLVTGEQTGFNVYTASTGQPLGTNSGKFHLLDGGGDTVAFHPRERFWLAVNRDPVLFKDKDQQGFWMLDLSAIKEARKLQTFPETTPVAALAVHPSGAWLADLLNTGAIHVWEATTAQRVGAFTCSP